jgi:class 3 adenylate cyclase
VAGLPEVRYARSAGAAIAHQVFGDGPADLVYLPPWGNLVWNWQWPPYAEFLRRLASFGRVIVTDRRGFGCSSGTGVSDSFEVDVDDLFAVIEDAQGPPPALFGAGDFTPILAAATHPERVSALVLFHPDLPGTRSDEHPWLQSEDEWDGTIKMFGRISNTRERVEQYVRRLEPSLRDDPRYVEWALGMFPLNCSPDTWIGYLERMRATEAASVLPLIRVPTLVLVRPEVEAHNAEVIGNAKYIADQIPDAQLVELPGADLNAWVGDSGAVLDAVEAFLVSAPRAPEQARALATILFTDIVQSTKMAAAVGDTRWKVILAAHHERARAVIATHRGREVDAAGDGFLATFDGPARAVACAIDICRSVRDLELEVRAGCHTGEVERMPDGISGIAVHIGARIAARAGGGEVLVSQTVKDLTAGSGLRFEDTGEHELKGVPERWRVYRVLSG